MDVQLVASTTGPPARLVPEGRFDLPLFYRLSGAVLSLPLLAKQGEDILPSILISCWRQRRGWTGRHLQ